MIFENFFETVGKTPIVKFDKYKGAEIFIKLEGNNPSGSLKDRSAKAIILDKIKNKELIKGKTILDASSGSFACSIAYFGKILGFPVTVVANSKITESNKSFLKIMGANIIYQGNATIEGNKYCTELINKDSNKYCFLDQLNNWNSPKAHYNTTAPEILKDIPNICAVATSMGSGATLWGLSKYLKKHKSDIKIITSYAKKGSKIAGTFLEGTDYKSPFIKEIWKNNWIDHIGYVNFEEALKSAQYLAQKGFFVGPQTGGVLVAMYEAIDKLNIQGKVLIISGDSGWKNLHKLAYQ